MQEGWCGHGYACTAVQWEHVQERMVSTLPVGNGVKEPSMYVSAEEREKEIQEKTSFFSSTSRERGRMSAQWRELK